MYKFIDASIHQFIRSSTPDGHTTRSDTLEPQTHCLGEIYHFRLSMFNNEKRMFHGGLGEYHYKIDPTQEHTRKVNHEKAN